MKLKGLLLFFMLLFAWVAAYAQQYNYRHYTTQDGLPSSTVYSIVQDDEGFMWFGTSQGVARYDGYNFKTYTVLDGLPDNDVLAIFKGQNGRLWFVCFNKQLSYYDAQSGEIRIYEQYNLPTIPIQITETTDNEVWIGTKDRGLLVVDSHQTTLIDSSGLPMVDNYFQPFLDNNNQMWLSGRMRFFQFNKPSVQFDLNPFSDELDDGRLGDFAKLHQLNNGSILAYTGRQIILLDSYGNLKSIFTTQNLGGIIINSISSDSENNILVATQIGAFLLPNDSTLPYERFLTDKPISHFKEDNEGNYWFSTLNDGIYMLPASGLLVDNLSSRESHTNVKISSLFTLDNDVFFTAHNGIVGGWVNGAFIEQLVQKFYLKGLNDCIHLNDSLICCSSDYGVITVNSISGLVKSQLPIEAINGYDSLLANRPFVVSAKPSYISLGGIKHLTQAPNNSFWLLGETGLMHAQYENGEQQITIKRQKTERITAASFDGEANFWFSTLDSIGQVSPEGTISMVPLEGFGITGNITGMVTDHHQNLWFATAGYGLYVFDGDSLYNIGQKDNLSSAFVNAMVLHDSTLILGTARGVNVITLSPHKPYYSQVYPLSINDALVSQEINALLVHQQMLYMGTNKGISLAPAGLLVADTTKPRVYLSRLQINDADTTILEGYTLPHYLNNIKLEYIGLLYKANGNLQYRYQMEGVDTGWVQTTFTNVQYPTLPPGKYTFKVDSRSLQGPWSEKPATMQITILPPFWKTWWFRLLVAMVLVGIVTGISYAIIKYYRNQSLTTQRMVELEGQALRANMNPHFVFNALNAIHDFIANQDERSAHLYLGKFAQLIRSILDQSRRNFISLDEELDTLRLYLELENMRFEHKFEYRLKVEDTMQPYDIELPPMLIQPYIENAIRHGLMDLGKPGHIEVAFVQQGSNLKCTITDNGIGRAKAMEISSKRLKSHRSAGMEITQKRIELLNDGKQNGEVNITDLYDNNGQATGTKVELTLPLKVH